jgi:hypothetical protein
VLCLQRPCWQGFPTGPGVLQYTGSLLYNLQAPLYKTVHDSFTIRYALFVHLAFLCSCMQGPGMLAHTGSQYFSPPLAINLHFIAHYSNLHLPAVFSTPMLVTGLFGLVTLGAYPGCLALDRGYSVSPFVSSLTVQSQYGTLVVHTGQGFLIFGIVV